MDQFVSRFIANFGTKLFNEADSSEPTLCSPVSVEIVLAMLALGCKDKSNVELLRALNIPDDDVLRSSFAYITSTLKPIRGATLNIASKLYIKKNKELKPSVKKDYEEIFYSSIEHVDFNVHGAAYNAINNWLAQKTNGSNCFRGTLDNNTHLLFVNSIYFQGEWEKPFDTRLDTYSLFYTPNTTEIAVILMKIPKTWFKYGVSEELKARLKFEGGEASMVIVLPDETNGLMAMLRKLNTGHNIMADIETLRDTELDVMIPRFQVRTTSQLNLVSHLLKLDIRSIFDERRSEVNMFTTNDNLLGSNADQYTFIQVDDRESTETAEFSRSTVKDITDHGVDSFVANRPFLYMIIVRGLPIFMGTYTGRQPDILNYSCNHLNQTFSLSACTFYSRYDNIHEQERLTRILEDNMRQVIWTADLDNRRNRGFQLRPDSFRSDLHYFVE